MKKERKILQVSVQEVLFLSLRREKVKIEADGFCLRKSTRVMPIRRVRRRLLFYLWECVFQRHSLSLPSRLGSIRRRNFSIDIIILTEDSDHRSRNETFSSGISAVTMIRGQGRKKKSKIE